MASGSQSDTSLWLHNKLGNIINCQRFTFWALFIRHSTSESSNILKLLFSGTSNDSWTGGSIVSQLTPDILVKIQHCFMVRTIIHLIQIGMKISVFSNKKSMAYPIWQVSLCLQDLQPQVKLKLLLSLFHIGRRNLEAWKSQLDGILAVAKEDSEPWVCMLAELIKTFPETGKSSPLFLIMISVVSSVKNKP